MSGAAEKFGKYQLLEKLGQGGMAEVFLAVAPGLAGFQKKLVLKRVLPDLEGDKAQVEMFLDEARLAARLEHPNICQVFDLGSHEGQYFIVMEHVPGVTFAKVIESFHARGQPVPLDVGLRTIAQLLEALEYAHTLKDERGRALNLVHRDVTPSNVMVTPQGSVKLLDFGIARATTRQHRTQVGVTKGKLGYMSPEQCRAETLDNRSDLFAVGAMLYVLATGQQPYETGALSTEIYEDMVLARFPPPREVKPDVAPELERVILKAMAVEPVDRYRRAFDMLREVEAVAQRLGVSLGPNALAQVVQRLLGGAAARDEVATRAHTIANGGDDGGKSTARVTREQMDEVRKARLATGDARVPLPDVSTQPEREATPGGTVPELPPVPEAGRSMAVAAALAVVAALVVTAAVVKVVSGKPEETTTVAQPVPVAQPVLVPPEDPAPAPPEPAAEPLAPPPQADPLVAAPPDVAQPPPDPPAQPPQVAVATPPQPEPTPAEPTKPPEPTRPTPAKPVLKPVSRPAVTPTVTPPPAAPPKLDGPTGVLAVTSTPSAKVRFGNQVLGATPLEVTLPEGTQRIELLYPGEAPRRLLVNIVAGKRTPLTDTR